MQQQQRTTLRIAERIRDQLLLAQQRDCSAKLQSLSQLMDPIEQLTATRRKLAKAAHHRYEGAGKRLLNRASRLINDLEYHLSNVGRSLTAATPTPPGASDLLSELDQLEQEFGNWSYESYDDTIRVTTDPIELEGRYLGPFEIRLVISELENVPARPPYLVVAQDPHPASSADHVTHPHVSDERLCAGDALTALNAALESGRLCDFFVLVRSVLTNYNPDSPYVSLDDWDGEQCEDCGGTIYEDSRYRCELCERVCCDQCIGHCRSCDESTCLGCLSDCPQCEESTCSDCLSQCAVCAEKCCTACLDESLCPTCKEQHDEEETEEESQEESIVTQGATPNGAARECQPIQPTR